MTLQWSSVIRKELGARKKFLYADIYYRCDASPSAKRGLYPWNLLSVPHLPPECSVNHVRLVPQLPVCLLLLPNGRCHGKGLSACMAAHIADMKHISTSL